MVHDDPTGCGAELFQVNIFPLQAHLAELLAIERVNSNLNEQGEALAGSSNLSYCFKL